MILAFEPEPSTFLAAVLKEQDAGEVRRLCPWRLPLILDGRAPSPLRRFVQARCQRAGQGLFGYPAVELAARAWAGTRTDRRLHSRFVLRRLLGQWAARHSVLRDAQVLVAPSCAARALFAAAPKAKKILVMDMPGLRQLHRDLDSTAAVHRSSIYLHRYRVADSIIVDQEVEWRLADEIHVRGRFAQELLLSHGVPEASIKMATPARSVPLARASDSRENTVHVLLAGLASARHGTHELLKELQARPWLHVHARAGEGCEPAAFLKHPRVQSATALSLSKVDALLVPSFCETYLPEVSAARRAGIPIIASKRGAGMIPPSELFAELPPGLTPALGAALDALRL